MRKLTVLFCIFAFLCSTALAVELDLTKFMPVDEIKPSMKGIGKTVFQGTEIEEFQVEVLDVSKGANGPKGDLIWALCSGGPLAETGILQGMSGSPVYIDGRLIGAVSYSVGSFPKRPIAGITPIVNMLEIFDNAESDNGYSMIEDQYTEAVASLLKPDLESGIHNQKSSIHNNVESLTALQTPIIMSGFHPKTIQHISSTFEQFGMIPVQGGGASSEDVSEEVLLKPGASLGIQFVRGDASSFGHGTLTHIENGKILGFGHSMYGAGNVKLPMVGGRVGLLVPSLLLSSKRAAPVKTIGTLIYDGEYGVMGVIGEEPEFIPMKIRINSGEYNFEIAEYWLFSPMFIYTMALNTIYYAEKQLGDYTMRTHSEIKLKGYPAIIRDNIFSGRSPRDVATDFAAPVYSLMQSSFEEVDVESILLEIDFEEKRANASLQGVRLSKEHVRPGDSVGVTVFLRPYMEDIMVKNFDVAIPKDAPEGPAYLVISDAKGISSWERSRAPVKASTMDMDHLIQRIQEEENNGDIIIELFAPQLGVTIRDKELPALPLTTFSVMNSRKNTGPSGVTRGTTFLKQRIHTDYAISGSTMMFLNIDRDAP